MRACGLIAGDYAQKFIQSIRGAEEGMPTNM